MPAGLSIMLLLVKNVFSCVLWTLKGPAETVLQPSSAFQE